MLTEPDKYELTEGVLARMRGREVKLLAKAWRAWRPPLKLTISQWADEYRRLPMGVTSEPGRYSSDRLPWCRFIMDAIGSRAYRDNILVGAAQVMAKTEMLNNIVGYYIHADPSPILVKYPTIDSGEAWSKAKFTPMVDATPVLREIIGESKSRDSGNTITNKKYAGGGLTVIGANSPSGMRQRSKRVIIQDEIDADEHSAGVEGDPVTLADKRAEAYPDAVKVKASTPTIAGHSRSWKLLENSTFHEWHVKPDCCGEYQVLKMSCLKWPRTKTDEGKEIFYLEQTKYHCEKCGAEWDDLDRQRAIMAGKAIARNPDSKIFGFHIGGLYKLIGGKEQFSSMLEEFAVGFLEAKKGGAETLKVWTNTFKAECWEEEFEKLDEKAVLARAESYEPDVVLPAGVLRIEGAADVQGDRIEAELIGFGEGEETWGLGYHVFHGDTAQLSSPCWQELDKIIAKTFKHASGAAMAVKSFFVDSGTKQDEVLKFTGPRKARGVFACKGYNSVGKVIPILGRKPSINNKRKVPQWMIGVTSAKTVIYGRIMLPVPGAGSMHYPKGHGYDARYFRQLTSEKRIQRYAHGRPYYIFEAGDRRNEPLDIRVYALAAHRRVMFDAEKLKAELSGTALQVPEQDDTPEEAESVLRGTSAEDLRAGGMQFERAPIEQPSQAAAVIAKPAPVAGSFTLPDYVPMSQRNGNSTGESIFKT
jgi:phage terminase large subunit GpA-like protein